MLLLCRSGPEYASCRIPEYVLPPSRGIMFNCTPPVSRSAPMPLVSATTSWKLI